MNNAISLIKGDLQRHKVTVTLPGEKKSRSLFLMMVAAKTSKLADFKETYGDAVTALHLKLAEKIFRREESENIFGIFVDDSLQMVFAFNLAFADYNSEKKAVVFRDVDDLVVNGIGPEKSKEHPKIQETVSLPDFHFERSGCTGGRISYSVTEKKTE